MSDRSDQKVIHHLELACAQIEASLKQCRDTLKSYRERLQDDRGTKEQQDPRRAAVEGR